MKKKFNIEEYNLLNPSGLSFRHAQVGSLMTITSLAASTFLPNILSAQSVTDCGIYSAVISADVSINFGDCVASAILDINGDGIEDLTIYNNSYYIFGYAFNDDFRFLGNTNNNYYYMGRVLSGESFSPDAFQSFYSGSFTAPNWPKPPLGSETHGFIPITYNGHLGFIELTIDYLDNNEGFCMIIGTATGVGYPVVAIAGDCEELNTPLPITLTTFTADNREKSILLNWSTSLETNNQGFEIQRSLDGKHFSKIAFVEGNYNSASTKEYFYDDLSAKPNQQYYFRLKQLDLDGQYSYSPIVKAIMIDKSSLYIQDIFPNPAQETFQLELNSFEKNEVDFSIFDNYGRSISNQTFEVEIGLNTYSISIAELPSGVYIAKINEANGSTQFKKFIKN